MFSEPELNSDYRWHVGLISYIISHRFGSSLQRKTMTFHQQRDDLCESKLTSVCAAGCMSCRCRALTWRASVRGREPLQLSNTSSTAAGRAQREAAKLIYNFYKRNSCSAHCQLSSSWMDFHPLLNLVWPLQPHWYDTRMTWPLPDGADHIYTACMWTEAEPQTNLIYWCNMCTIW